MSRGCDNIADISTLQKEQCKRSFAALDCHPDPEKKMKCFPESSQPETEENCLVGKIDKKRRTFVKHTKDDLTKIGLASFDSFAPKPKVVAVAVVAEATKEPELPKGAIHEFDEFKTPFSETNSSVSGSSEESHEETPKC